MGVAANMIVRLGMDLTGFSSGAKKATNEFSSAVKKMSSSVGKIPKLNTKNLYQLSEEPQKELDALNNAIERQQKLIKGLTAQLGNIAPEGFDALTKSSKEDVAYLEKQIQKSKELRSELLNKRYGDSGYEDAAEKVKELTSYIASMEKKLQQTFNSTKIASGLSEAAKQVNAQLDMMQNRKIFLQAQVDTSGVESVLQDMVNPSERDDALDEFENRINQLRAEMDGASVGKKFSLAFRQVALEAEDAIKHIPKLAASAAGASLKAFEKIPSVLSKITHPIQTLTSKFPQMSKAAKDAGGGVGNAFMTMLKYTVGIRSLYILISKLRSALVTGFGNLAKESSQTNYALSTLKSSLTMLQNSFAAAFSPLVNTVAPILASFIQTIADAISYVGAFFATLTGQGSYTRAVYNYQSIADSAGSAASGTDAANKAAEKYQKTLAGFDEITKLNDQNSSGGSGGGVGGSGGVGSGVNFETVSIPNVVSDWAEKFMKAWEKADFTEFGTIVGTKLKNALDSIDWPGIQEKCEKVAKSVATFLNGFFETEDLGTAIGKTIGNAFNTKLDFENTFMEAFRFDSLGSFITSGIQAALDEVDFSQITRKISNQIISVADFLRGCIESVNWKGVPQGIWDALVEAFNGIKWSEIASSISGLAGAAAGAVAGILSGIAQAVTDNYKKLTESGGNILAGIFQGIVNALINIPQWIKENIFTPFINGFKAAFGIHSPASAPELLKAASYVGEGILNGILQPFNNISNWVSKNILTPIKDAFVEFSLTRLLGNVGNHIEITASVLLKKGKKWAKEAFVAISASGKKLKATVLTTLKNAKDNLISWVMTEIKNGKDIKKTVSATLTNAKETVVSWFLDKIKSSRNVVKTIPTTLSNAKDTVVSWFLTKIKAGSSLVKTISATLSNAKETVVSWFMTKIKNGSTIKKTVSTTLSNAKDNLISWLMTKVKNGSSLKKSLSVSVTAKISSWLEWLVKKVQSGATLVAKVTQSGSAYATGKGAAGPRAMGGMYRNGHWSPIQAYASGGLPNQGQMFIAREAGPELVGSIGSGTAVMNNDQIVASVSAGVYKAVLAAMSGNRSGGNQNLTVQVILDSKVAGEAFVNYLKGQAAQGNFPLAGLT